MRPTTSHPKLALAAVAGLMTGLLAPHARKAFIQGPTLAAKDWVAGLTAEHRMVQAAFRALVLTDQEEERKRKLLLAKIAYALTKHGIEEENVIYPALQAVRPQDASRLVDDHAQIKRYIYILRRTPASHADWLATVEEFSHHTDHHIHEEEDEIFPALQAALSDEDNTRLAGMLNWEGFKVA